MSFNFFSPETVDQQVGGSRDIVRANKYAHIFFDDLGRHNVGVAPPF